MLHIPFSLPRLIFHCLMPQSSLASNKLVCWPLLHTTLTQKFWFKPMQVSKTIYGSLLLCPLALVTHVRMEEKIRILQKFGITLYQVCGHSLVQHTFSVKPVFAEVSFWSVLFSGHDLIYKLIYFFFSCITEEMIKVADRRFKANPFIKKIKSLGTHWLCHSHNDNGNRCLAG